MQHKHHWLMGVGPAFVASFMKKFLGIKRELVSTSNGKFFADPVSNFGYALTSENGYEPDMIDSVERILKKGDVFLDIGANEGFFSIVASKSVGKYGKVVCIEPQSRLQSTILRNISENQLDNINLLQRAISDEIGTATLSLSPDMNTGSSGIFRTAKYKTPTEMVPQTTLSELFETLKMDSVKLMKMDIEGFEYEAILGSKELFEKGLIENIALELHPTILERRGKPESDITKFLEKHGYKKNLDYKTLIMSKST